jgi:hypothetical protein
MYPKLESARGRDRACSEIRRRAATFKGVASYGIHGEQVAETGLGCNTLKFNLVKTRKILKDFKSKHLSLKIIII